MAGHSRFDGPYVGLQAALGWAAFALVVLSVIPQGGNQPIAWTLMAFCVLGLFVVQVGVSALRMPARAVRIAIPLALVYSVVVAWGLVQALWAAPDWAAHPAWAEVPGAVVPRISGDPDHGVHIALRLSVYAMIAWIFVNAALSSQRALMYLSAFALFSTALAVFGLVAGLGGSNPLLGIESGASMPVSATFVNRNSYATYAAFGLLTNVALYLHHSSGGLEEDTRIVLRGMLESFFRGNWIFMLGALLCGAAVALTLSRAGGVAAILGLAVLLSTAARQGKGALIAVGAVAVIVAGFVVFSLGSGTFDRVLAGEGGQQRMAIYTAIVEQIPERPWLGHGLGAFHDTFRAHVPLEAAEAEWNLAHSSYLENAYEMGLPAAVLFYGVLVMLGLRFFTGIFTRQTDTVLPALALSVWITAALHSLVDFSLQMPGAATAFAMLMGIGWAQSFSHRDRASLSRGELSNDI